MVVSFVLNIHYFSFAAGLDMYITYSGGYHCKKVEDGIKFFSRMLTSRIQTQAKKSVKFVCQAFIISRTDAYPKSGNT